MVRAVPSEVSAQTSLTPALSLRERAADPGAYARQGGGALWVRLRPKGGGFRSGRASSSRVLSQYDLRLVSSSGMRQATPLAPSHRRSTIPPGSHCTLP
jgi:hypothetical protein